VQTRDGALDVRVEGGPAAGIWRVMTRLPGTLRPRLHTSAEARAAGAAVAGFHDALIDVEHRFAFSRPGAHDTAAHVGAALDARDAHVGHRLHAEVAPLIDRIALRWQAWLAATGGPPKLPRRIVHGDLKAANLLFAAPSTADDADNADNAPRVSAILDLDTMAHGTLDIELGDALRSWCAPAEDAPTASFDARRFAAAVDGYRAAAGPWLQPAELRSLPWSVERIATELAARFAADALHERYFGWDPTRAVARGEHNLLRAQNQLALAADIERQRPALQAAVERALSRS
jgi:Ser/Thr protein kinase RdoA (MazF antagonist)